MYTNHQRYNNGENGGKKGVESGKESVNYKLVCGEESVNISWCVGKKVLLVCGALLFTPCHNHQ